MIYDMLTRYMDRLFETWDILTDEQKETEARRMAFVLDGILEICRAIGCANHAYIQLRDTVAIHGEFWNMVQEVQRGKKDTV